MRFCKICGDAISPVMNKNYTHSICQKCLETTMNRSVIKNERKKKKK